MNDQLPRNWTVTRLENCVDILDKFRDPINADNRKERIKGLKKNELIPYYGATGQVGWIDDFIFDEELILLGEDGAPFLDSIKDVAYKIKGKSWVNNHAHVLRAKENIALNDYILHQLNTVNYKGYTTGTTRLKLNQSQMKKIEIVLPPLEEQQRIVDKVEELFSKIDDGIKSLQKVKKQLNHYRQSVLKAAVEGKLTQEWREENRESLELADQLLERVLEERRERWEEEYRKKYEDKGKDLPSGWKSRYSEPESPDISDLPKLHDEWTWVTFDQTGHWKGGGTPKKSVDKYWNGSIPWVSPKEMKRKWIEDTQDHTNELGIDDSSTKLVNSHSLLLVTRSGILKHTLPAAINTTDVTVNQDMKALETVESINTEYLYLCTQTFNGDILHECSKHGTTVQSLESDKLYSYIIPLPPLGEQQEIVNRAERILSVIDQHEKTLSNEFKRAKNLKSSVLKKAFRGELVQQDPNDEPASELFKGITNGKKQPEEQFEMEL